MGEITTAKVIKAIKNQRISRFGPPITIITNQCRQFTSEAMPAYCQAYGIKPQCTTSYHPQNNVKIERFHRSMKYVLQSHTPNSETFHVFCLGLRKPIRIPGDLVDSETHLRKNIELNFIGEN